MSARRKPGTRVADVSPHPYVVLGATLAGGLLLFVGAMSANWFLRPRNSTTEKLTTYESGVDPVGSGWAQSYVRYYLYAFVYVIFAVDAAYLFPWATVVEHFGWPTLAEMGVFIGLLILGLVHAWRRRALQWT
jgi:NADH-quinone oxidoreductase subunit A